MRIPFLSARKAFGPIAAMLVTFPVLTGAAEPQKLRVGDDHHTLVREDGQPFFYLADTAWELFHRLNREQTDEYLRDRAAKGFTVIQAVALAELTFDQPNAYGHLPLTNNDPTKPTVVDGPRNDYWDHVDYVVDRAESLGLYVGFLPTWGDKWNKKWGAGPVIFTADNARVYGEWLGRRYAKKPIIWILGGDRPIENEAQREIQAALAAGLRAGDGGAHLITFHPSGREGSSTWFHDAPWLDFNMRQNGHGVEYVAYNDTLKDFNRTPPKPVVDGEPIYEDHPISFKPNENGYSVAGDVRRAIYWDVFNGACGFAYGNHAIWQMNQPGREPVNGPMMSWSDALHEPGSSQVHYLRQLMEARPFFHRIPDPALIADGTPAAAWRGEGRYRFVGTRDVGGTYAMIYAPVGRKFTVNLQSLSGKKLRAWWFNPRNGKSTSIGEFQKVDRRDFVPPDEGEILDWVLVIDDAAQKYPAPGSP